jgi:hypothetical protein
VDASAIGLRLSPSFLMQPCKSVSLVIGAGSELHAGGQPCEECGASATCRREKKTLLKAARADLYCRTV